MATTTPYKSHYRHGTLLFSNYQFTQDYKNLAILNGPTYLDIPFGTDHTGEH